MQLEPRLIGYRFRAMNFEDAKAYRETLEGIHLKPRPEEFALGLLEEQIDPLVREALIILTRKGYLPFESCQGHVKSLPPDERKPFEGGVVISMEELSDYYESSDVAHLVFAGNLTEDALQYFLERELKIKCWKPFKPTDENCPGFHLIVPHLDRRAADFLGYMNYLAKDAPTIGDMLYINELKAVEFRYQFGYNDSIPPDKLRSPHTSGNFNVQWHIIE